MHAGSTHPATFTGRIVDETMTLTVTLTDTARVLGPVTLVYGKEPQMGPCPICRIPPGVLHVAFFDTPLTTARHGVIAMAGKAPHL